MHRALKFVVTGVLAVLALLCLAFLLLSTRYEVADEPTPLMKAALLGSSEQVGELLAAGADVNERRGHSAKLGIFIAHGPSTPIYGDTALLAAIDGGSVDTVRTLLDAGADPTARDNLNRGIWDYAALRLGGGSGVFLLLADRFVVPRDAIDQVLYQVGYIDNEKLLEFALSHPSSVPARQAAFCGATGRADIEMMTRVLQTLDHLPPSSLSCALNGNGSRRSVSVGWLLERGADANDGGESVRPLSHVLLSMTPGTAAVEVPDGSRDLLEMLMKHGADPYLPSPGGLNSIDLARKNGHEAAALLLERRAAEL